jgi:hypothetical protein
MSRRKFPSKRRVKARFNLGRPVPEPLILARSLYGWIWINHPEFSKHDFTVRKTFRGSNA